MPIGRGAGGAKGVRRETAEKLIAAAAEEFNTHGYGGTDTNRIARRAGFAPQTFYRWFADKAEIFIRVYDQWQQQEARTLGALLAENASDSRVAAAVVEHHRDYLVFRRSLRQLSLEDERVRAARAASRVRQVGQILIWRGATAKEAPAIAAALLQMERLADALAEGEFRDMGLDDSAGEAALAAIIQRLRSKPAEA
ncbi:TetR/AcrR family transcriptional regulator [uncultured Phenylobacterium sp.]|uniref:TetR/AcrR family transcriptional regulator n=1 Tax=uncultured Phenylobacterium sp. TaxID=349273 RepID=UPI0025DCE42C|nr:TetR/AcrR family transcriptional regulator [uncultured Phenylobacterium sp.]